MIRVRLRGGVSGFGLIGLLIGSSFSSWAHAQTQTQTEVEAKIEGQTQTGAQPPTQDKASVWMLSASGGSISREGDGSHADGTIAVTRRIGRGYVRASVARFGAAVVQGDIQLPSTYTIGFLSTGVVLGHWFVDGYAAGGTQHYDDLRTLVGQVAVIGAHGSGIIAGGLDGGYVAWSGAWSLTPSLSAQYVESKALRAQPSPDGLTDYETRETGATLGATLRLDRWLGEGRRNDVGLHVSAFDATNASAALVSGARGGDMATLPGGRQSDAWLEAGVSASAMVTRRLYLDVSGARTVGVRSGDVTTTSVGVRIPF